MLALALLHIAHAADHEVYAGTHLDVTHAEGLTGVGLTGQLGYRLHLGRFTVGAAAAFGSIHDPVTGLELEAGMHLRPKAKIYKPWIGVEAVGLFADPRTTTSYRDVGVGDLRLALRPLAFHFGPISMSTMELSWGEAERNGAWRTAFGLNALQMGVIF
ncbi:MAG: hypothetical protein KC656_30995 [Myxococcales bacterium]|nr:hypothetical protein [Myxococcales bacterium]MCB9671807.1 hypothetical protein [Alphaproteobacteria bacterium]